MVKSGEVFQSAVLWHQREEGKKEGREEREKEIKKVR